MALTDNEMAKLEEQLKPQLTEAFLITLAEAARICGWRTDHHETVSFVEFCYDLAGRPSPDLVPYGEEGNPQAIVNFARGREWLLDNTAPEEMAEKIDQFVAEYKRRRGAPL